MAVIATDQCTLSVAVDVESVETWYMQVAASANAPAKPTVADPSSLGWTTTEPGFDAQNSKKLYTCQKTTLTDGTFMWGSVQLSSSYTGASTALNTANAAATAASNAEKVATNYITALSGNGIWVTPSDAKPSAQGAATSTTSGWHISDAIELFRLGVSHIKMWVENSVAKLRLGAANSTHVVIDADSLDVEDGSSNVLATFGSNGAQIGDKTSGAWVDISNDAFAINGIATSENPLIVSDDEYIKILSMGLDENDDFGLIAYGGEPSKTHQGKYEIKEVFKLKKFEGLPTGFGYRGFALYSGDVSMDSDLTTSSSTKSYAALYGQVDAPSGESVAYLASNAASGADSGYVGRSYVEARGSRIIARGDYSASLQAGTSGQYYLTVSSSGVTTNMNIRSSGNTLTLGSNTTGEENGIRIKGGGTRNAWLLRNISAANGDGDAVLLGNGGLTIVGAGESAANLWTALGVTAGDETLHLASDNSIQLHANCGTIANRQTVAITANGSIIGPNNHAIKLADVDSSASDNGVSATTYRYHSFLDESDRYIGWLGTTVATSGNITTSLAARTRNGSANLDNVLSLGVTKSGTRTVSVSDAGVWRSALGLGTAATHADTDYADASHSHSEYFSDQVNRTANTVLAAPNGSAGHASFRRLAMADLVSSFHHNTSHANIPVVTTAPTAVNTSNWNYEVYSDGEVHAWGTFMRTVTLTTKIGDGFYWNSTLLYLALPVKAKFIQSVNYSMSLGGSGGAGAYCMPGGSAHTVWSGATFYLPFYIARPVSTASQSYWFSVDVWYMKA